MICHGIPDRRPLQDGDIVNVDVTAFYQGFHGDLNETFVVGEVDEESKNLIRVTAEASINTRGTTRGVMSAVAWRVPLCACMLVAEL